MTREGDGYGRWSDPRMIRVDNITSEGDDRSEGLYLARRAGPGTGGE